MKTLDLRKEYRVLYQPSARAPQLVDVPEFLFLMIDGRFRPGDTPETSVAFRNACQALYSGAYALKFMSRQRKAHAVDYRVMPLEAIWWVEDEKFDLEKPGNWYWRAMIMQPAHITPEMLDEVRERLLEKKPSPALGALCLERYQEGLCVQMMHIGPYATEPGTVARIRAFVEEHGMEERHDHIRRTGRLVVYDHHEIYLGDPRRASPEKLKTVLRHPVVRKKNR